MKSHLSLLRRKKFTHGILILFAFYLQQIESSLTSSKEINKYIIEKNTQAQTNDIDLNTYGNIHLRDLTNFKKSILLNQNFNLNFDRFDYEKSLDNMTFVYGAHSTLWILGKSVGKPSEIYVSHNNGKSFNLFKNKLTRGSKIDNIFSSRFNHFNLILSDSSNKKIYKSTDGGSEFSRVDVPFHASTFHFVKDPNVLIGIEENDGLKNIWISFDFGNRWKLIAEGLSLNPAWTNEEKIKYVFYAETDESTGLISLVKLDLQMFKEGLDSSKEIVSGDANVLDFQMVENFIFILFGKTKQSSSFIIYKLQKNRLQKKLPMLDFNGNKNVMIQGFHVVSVTSDEIFISFVYEYNKEIKTDLLRSTKDDFYNFRVSLSEFSLMSEKEMDKVYDDIKATKTYDSAEIKSLNKKYDLFIANAGKNKKTFIKGQKKEWTPIEFDKPNFYLDLSKNFYFSHMHESSMLNRAPKYPDFMIATAMPVDNIQKPFVCISIQGDGSGWKKILEGNYLYSYADFGNVILALEKNKPIKELIYTDNFGHEWTKVKFTNNLVYADELIKEQYEGSSIFFLFASDIKTKQQTVFKISLDFMSSSEEDANGSNSQEVKCDDKCVSKTNSKKEICLTDDIICDGFYDCQDNQDERDCSNTNNKKPISENLVEAKVTINELKVKKDLFKLNFSVSFSDSMKNFEMNNCLIKIVTLKNRKILDPSQKSIVIKNVNDFFKKIDNQIDLSYRSFENNQNADKLETITQIQTDKLKNLLEVANLDDKEEYLLLFYVDLSFESKNVNTIYMLNESIVIRNRQHTNDVNDVYFINEQKLNTILYVVAVLACLTFVALIVYLFMAIRQKSQTSNKYLVLTNEKVNNREHDSPVPIQVYNPVTSKFKNIYKPTRKEDRQSLIKEMA